MIIALKRKIELFDSTGMSRELRRSLNMLILAITFGNVCFVVTTGTPLTGYLKALGMGDFLYSAVMAIPVLASGLQLVASYIMERSGKRRLMFIVAGFAQRFLWLPVGLIPYFVPVEQQALRVFMVFVFILLTSSAGAFMNVTFYSLCADLVPQRIRGRYFSTRSRISLVVSVISGILLGMVLDWFPGFLGYTIVFSVASVFGMADIACFFWIDFPEIKPAPKQDKIFHMIRDVIKNRNYIKVITYWTLWAFSVNVAGPFFNVYMIEHLNMSYLEMMLYCQVAANVATVFVITRWGRAMDFYGIKPVVRICASIACFLPIFWCLSGPRVFWIVPVIQVFSGLVWSALDLGAQNMFLNQSGEKNRSMYVAVYFMATQMIGTAVAYTVGGFLVENVMPLLEGLNVSLFGFTQTRYNFLFMLSMILRICTVFFILPRIAEEGSQPASKIISDAGKSIKRRLSVILFTVKKKRYLGKNKGG